MKKLMLSCFALCAFAAFGETMTIDVSELSGSVSKDGYAYDANAHLLTLREDRQFVLTGSSSDVRVYVTENVKSVTLNGLKLEHANGKGAPISLEDKSATDVVFALTNANVLVAPPQCAAIEVPRNATLTISADDDAAELNAVGGGAGKGDNDEPSDEYGDDPENGGEGGGAGIGMGWNADCGTIVILGGKVTAAGGNKAAGIGGGAAGGCAGNVEIFGGTILSAGGWGAAGIGSGYEQGNDQEFTPSHNGKIVISGGRVTAKGGDGGAGIGGGGYWRRAKYRPKGPDVEISGGTVSAKGGKAVRYKGWKTSYSPWDFGAGSNPDDEKLPKVVVRGGTVYATNTDDSWHFNKEPCQSAEDEWPVGGVYPVYVRLGSSVADAKVEVVGLPQDYDVKDLYANEAGDLCFYLPAGKRVTFAVWWRDVDGTVVSKQFWAAPCEWRTEAQPLTVDGLLVNGVAVNNFTSGPGWVRDDYDRDRYIIRLNGSVERYVLTGMASNAVVSVENLNSTKVLELKDLCLEYGGILRWSMISFGNACRGKQVRLELNGVSFLQGHVNAISLCDGLFCEIDAAAGATNAVLIAAAGEVVNQVQTAATGAICGRGETLSEPMGTVALRGGCLYLEGGGADWGSNPIHSCAGLYAKTNIVSGGTLRVLAGKRGLGQNPPQPSMRASEANIFTGGSILAGDGKMSTEVAIRVAPTNGAGKAVHRVTVPVSGGTGDDRRVKISGVPDYGCKDIVALNGKAYLYLPDGDYVFTVNGKFVRATVNGADTEATDELGFTVNGTDVLAGPGEGWSYNGDDGTLMIFGAGTYVLSGGAMFDEVQVNVAGPQNPTVVLSNAVIFTEVRPALNVATGATLALAAGQVMMAGDAPETMRYAADWAGKTSILAGPGATVTVKDGIPHVTATVVSNRTGTVSGAATEGGRAYRVLLGDDIFVGYTVEKGYFPRAENPLRYPAVGGDITVDANTIPTAANIPYRAWNPTTRQMEDRVCSGYEVVTEETTTFENGKWYAVTNTVQRGMITVRGAAHLILCDGAKLTAIGGRLEAGIAVAAENSLAVYGQALGTGELVAKGAVASSGIGGKQSNGSCGMVTIDGGRVTATGGKHGAGIGGEWGGAAGMVTINGGQVLAQGGRNAAGIGGGNQGVGGTVTINGGTVRAAGGSGAGIGRGRGNQGVFTLTIGGGSVKANIAQDLAKNSTPTNVYCVTAKCPSFAKATEGKPLGLEGLEGYGTNDIYVVEEKVCLWLPNGTYRFTLSDGSTTHRYFAVVKGIDITVEPLPPSIAVGFFVNGEDIGDRAGTGWTYGGDKVLSLNGNGTYVLSGEGTNDVVQVRVTQPGATVVLSNAVVFTEGRPALDVAQGAALQMAGGASFLGTTNNASAVSIAQGAELVVDLAPGANRLETMIGVFNYDAVAAVAGQGSAKVNGGTFFVWADAHAVGTPVNFTYGMGELMKTGMTPEAMTYAETCSTNPCVLVGPAVTVMVRGIPHVTDVVVSNRIEAIAHATTVGGTVYRVMLGDDVFVGYALEEGYVTDADNPLAYASIENDVTVDETVIPAVRAIPFRDWNAETRQMEDWICADYTVVTADTATFEDDQWYVVTNTVSRGTIAVNGAAHLILCDGMSLEVASDDGAGIRVEDGCALTIYGQSLGTGKLVTKGGGTAAGIGGDADGKVGTVTINGGMVTATGGKDAAGIGSGNMGYGGIITVNGGTVTAVGDGKPPADNAAGGGILPAGYTAVEYIESTTGGGQYIDTGYVPNIKTRIVADFNPFESEYAPNGNGFFGVLIQEAGLVSSVSIAMAYVRRDTIIGMFCNEFRVDGFFDGFSNRRMVAELKRGEITIDDGVKSVSRRFSSYDQALEVPIYLFCVNNGGKVFHRHGMRLYSFEIYEDGTPKRNFVPCVTSAGEAGLYDTVEGKFYGNAGDGKFAHGDPMAIADGADIGGVYADAGATVTINGGSVVAETVRNAPTNGMNQAVYRVKAKCEGIGDQGSGIRVEGLEGYGTDGIRPIDGCVCLWLPNGVHGFTLSDGTMTLRYCAVVEGSGVTIEPLGPVGFFVNGEDIGVDGIGDGWNYQDRVLTLRSAKTFVLSGAATTNEVQVKADASDATVVLSNAVVFTEGRPALDIAQKAALKMAGCSSFLGTMNDTAAVSVASGATLTVDLAPDANRNEARIGVFNCGSAATIAGAGSTAVNGGTFFVWGDLKAVEAQDNFSVGADEVMRAGNGPEEMKYVTACGSSRFVLVGPAVTVTVKNDNPHITGFAVSNSAERIQGTAVAGGSAYRVMTGDDVFVYYTLAKGCYSDVKNPLSYISIDGNVTIDRTTIPTVRPILYRDWNAETRQMEEKVRIEYEIVTANTATFEDGKWYVVTDPVSCGMITVNGAAHLILCDGAKLTAAGGANNPGIKVRGGSSLNIYGQAEGTGVLVANGGDFHAGIGGDNRYGGGTVTINGGMVTATGNRGGAGIGGGYLGCGGTVTINGGMVTATGGRDGAGIGGGERGAGGMVTINGGTVTATGQVSGSGIGKGCSGSGDGSLTIDGGSVKTRTAKDLAKNSNSTNVYCVTVKCPSFAKATEGKPLGLEGLEGYGTNDIYSVENGKGEGCVYLWLPDGIHRFRLSAGQKTLRYCAVVNGKEITVEPLGQVGFFVNGEDIGVDGIGDGWEYQDKVLTLNSSLTYVLSGEATNNEVQVRVATKDMTVVLSNAVVFTEGRPALDVAQGAALQMAGGTSYLAATNESAAVSVAEGATLGVGLAPNADRNESMIGVFNYGKAKAIAGPGAVVVKDGVFFVWADEQAVETPGGFTRDENEVMMTGKTPETLTYAKDCTVDPCVLVGPGATVTVKDITHVSDVVVSNLTGTVPGVPVTGGTAYRVMLGDSIFVGYTVEEGYVSPAENPLVYMAFEGDFTVDGDTIPVLPDVVSYIGRWNGTNETVVVTGNYVVVDAGLTTLASGVTYVVEGTVTNRNLLSLSGPATLVVCDGAMLVAEGGFASAGWPAVTNALSIHGQAAGDGLLFAKDFQGVDTAIHGITTVTDGIFGGTPVFLGGTVSANTVSNGQLMAVMGGNVCIGTRFAFAYDGGERPVYAVTCPVPGVAGRMTIEGLAGYCTEDIFPVDGVICLYLPKGEHVFTVNGVRMRALVIGDGTVAESDDGGYLAYGQGGELLGAFARLTNAVHAAANGGMVKLTNDCHEAGAFVLPEGAAVTLDGCGYRLTLDATDFSAPSALISTNAALCLTNIVLTRSAVSRNTGLLAVADGGAVEMRNCTVENCDAFVSPLISVANGGFRAADVRFFENTASVLVEAAVRSVDARFEIAKWSASGNVCDELFSVDNLSGCVDACEIGAGEQSWNGCGVADLSVGVGAACLRGAPPLPKVRLAGFAMGEDALHSHLVYRDAPPQGGVVLDVSSPDARIGSVIVSNAFNVAVAPQDVTLMTPGCRVTADAGGNLRLELASARPYIVRTITGAQTNYVPYATMEEAIAHGGRDILLMSYEESGRRQSVLAGNVSVPVGERFSLDTVRLTVTTNENWTAPSPDPVTLEGTIAVPTNTVLRLGNVLPREIDLSRDAYVLVEARPPERRYLYFRFSQDALDHILADGVVVASTCLSSAALKDVCAVLNEGYALVPVPADEVPAGLSGALWLTPTKYHEAWIVGEDAPRPSFIGAMESANDAVGHVDVTMRALSYTNETDGTVIGGYSSMGRGITVGGTNGNVRLTVGSWRIRVKGEERTVMNPPFPLTELNLDGSKLNIRKDSVLALADIDVVGAFTLVGEGVLNLSGYQGSKLSVFIDPAADGKPRRIAEAGATGKIQLAARQKGELFVNEEGVWWQLGVTCEYKQIANGKVRVTIRKNGEFKDEKDVMVTTGRATYTYDDGGVPRTFTLMAVYVDWANDDGPKMFAPRGASYETIGGAFGSFGDAIENGMPMPKDIRLIKNNGLKVRCKFPAGDFEADLLTDDPGPDQAPLDLSILSDDELEKMGIPDEDFDDPEIRDFVLGVIAVNAAIVAAGASGTIAYQTFKKWWKRFCNAITVIDLIRCIRNLITDAVRFKKYPLLYKEKWYPANQFTNLCARCAKDNGSGDKGNSILLRHAFSVDPLELGSVGFVKMDAEFSVWGDELARLLIDYTNKLDAVRDVVGLVVAILDLMISDEFDKWGLLAFGVEKVAMIIEMACFLSYRYEYPLPPLGGSLALSSGVKYDFVKMKFDALRKSRYLRAMGDNSPAGTVRTAPILVAKPGSTSEFDTCELRNFQYSSPSGLIYACSGATLVFKDFIVVSNTCTAVEKRPPIVAEKGATVWVCGNSAIEGIEAVGADLRIGYGPHGDDAPKASELTGKGTINVFGETGYGKEIGTATFPSATSNALNRIISRQYSNWVESVVSDVGGALKTVWKEKDGARQKLAPIKFKQGNPFSVSVIRSGTGNKATVTGGLEVPTKEAIDELPLEFSIDFTDSLKDGKVAETNVTVNPTTHDFKQEFDGLGNSQFFRLKYRNRLEGSK